MYHIKIRARDAKKANYNLYELSNIKSSVHKQCAVPINKGAMGVGWRWKNKGGGGGEEGGIRNRVRRGKGGGGGGGGGEMEGSEIEQEGSRSSDTKSSCSVLKCV